MTIGIIGFSRFGQLLAKILKPYGQVLVYNRSDKSAEAKELGVEYTTLEKVCQADWVFVSVAISATEDMIKQIAPLLKKGSLVMDVCSVKVLPSRWLEKYISQDNEIMATHPMFGPDSAKNGTKDLQWILCPLRISPETLNQVKDILNKLEVKIIETTPEDHDKQAAVSLSLVHFIGRGLEEFGIKDQQISTLGFERILRVNETVTNDSWQLFLDMQHFNPYANEARERFIESLKKVNDIIKQNKKGEVELAKRVDEIKESVTMAFDKKAKDMKAKHPETIILAAGEPDFLPPKEVVKATCEAAETGKTKYTPVKGIAPLLQAIATYISATRALAYDYLTRVMTTNGGKEGIYLALLSIVNPGDYVIIVAPYWTSYPEMVKMAGGIPLIIDYKELANLEAILKANPNVKAIILNSPSNPSGVVIAPEVLAGMAETLADKDIWVISDEIYSPIVYGDNKHVSIAQFPGMQAKTIIIDGASKAFAMTGYRLGYALGPKEVISSMAKFKSQISSCASSISQYAALAALEDSAINVKIMKEAYETRLNKIVLPFVKETGLEILPPQGAFYLFFKIPGENIDCLKFCEDLLEKEKLGLVPGMAFGYPGWVRISFASSDKDLVEGMARLKRFLQK